MPPQYPYSEQQSPNAEPAHVAPCGLLFELHVPSVETGGPASASHEPKPVWQPAPQWAAVLPQYPYCEQQLPKAVLVQVVPPLEGPQEPSGEALEGGVGAAEEIDDVDEVIEDVGVEEVGVEIGGCEPDTGGREPSTISVV